jgi:hypothetical protein
MKQQHTSKATSILTTKSTCHSLTAQRLSEHTLQGETWHKIPQRLNKFNGYLWRWRTTSVKIKVLESEDPNLGAMKPQWLTHEGRVSSSWYAK